MGGLLRDGSVYGVTDDDGVRLMLLLFCAFSCFLNCSYFFFQGTQTPHDQHGLPLDLFEEVSSCVSKIMNR